MLMVVSNLSVYQFHLVTEHTCASKIGITFHACDRLDFKTIKHTQNSEFL